jgi:inorganic pyrophosphatase
MSKRTAKSSPRALVAPTTLKPRNEDRSLRVVIETPKGSRNKYAFNPDLGAFELRKVLPAGMSFPYDFGFVPSTRADDDDPLDVLVLMDQPAFPGCVLSCRLIGIIHGHEKSKGEKIENDRLIAVEQDAHRFADIKTLADLGPKFLEELEVFFVNYHELDEKKYRTRGCGGPNAARRALKVALKASK